MSKTPRPHVVKTTLSDEEVAWLKQAATDENRSLAQVVRLALLHYYRSKVSA